MDAPVEAAKEAPPKMDAPVEAASTATADNEFSQENLALDTATTAAPSKEDALVDRLAKLELKKKVCKPVCCTAHCGRVHGCLVYCFVFFWSSFCFWLGLYLNWRMVYACAMCDAGSLDGRIGRRVSMVFNHTYCAAFGLQEKEAKKAEKARLKAEKAAAKAAAKAAK